MHSELLHTFITCMGTSCEAEENNKTINVHIYLNPPSPHSALDPDAFNPPSANLLFNVYTKKSHFFGWGGGWRVKAKSNESYREIMCTHDISLPLT